MDAAVYAGISAAISYGGLYYLVTQDSNTLMYTVGASTAGLLVGTNNTARNKLFPIVGGAPQAVLPPLIAAPVLYYFGVDPMRCLLGGALVGAATYLAIIPSMYIDAKVLGKDMSH